MEIFGWLKRTPKIFNRPVILLNWRQILDLLSLEESEVEWLVIDSDLFTTSLPLLHTIPWHCFSKKDKPLLALERLLRPGLDRKQEQWGEFILPDFLQNQKPTVSKQRSARVPLLLLPARTLNINIFLLHICMYFLTPVLFPTYCFLYFWHREIYVMLLIVISTIGLLLLTRKAFSLW